MRRFSLAATGLALSLACAGAAAMGGPPAAQQTAAPRATVLQVLHAKFTAANVSHDGHLTLRQAKAAGMTMVSDNFAAIDASNRGYITFNDILAWHMDQIARQLEARAAALRASD